MIPASATGAAVFFPGKRDMPQLETLMGFSEAHLRFIAESLPQIVWTGLPDGTIDYMNARWFEYTGLTPEETYQQRKTAVHPEDYLEYKRSWERAVRTQEAYEVEYRFRRAADGMYRWYLGRGLPLKNSEGVVVKWFGTCTDIHSQKEAEAQLRHLNEHLESIVLRRTAHLHTEIQERRKIEQQNRSQLQLLQRMINTLPMAAAVANPEGSVLHANEEFHSLFRHGSVLDRTYLQIFTDAEASLPSPEWPAVLDHLRSVPYPAFRSEVALLDGRTLLIECVPSMEENEGGFLLLVRDISRQKRVDAAKSDFMSLASHQLRTPLTAIRWALSRLKRQLAGRLNMDEELLLSQARTSALAMSQTIQTMLSISRIEAGLHSVNPSQFSVHEFFRAAGNAFEKTIAKKKLRFDVRCPDGFTILTDPVILREILDNLLSNAIKYTPPGGCVCVEAAAENGTPTITVRDTGYGIPLGQQEKVFSKFFRAENIVRLDTEGTGLGLYLVSQLTRALGGTISFTSEEGKGTKFTLRLA